MNYLEIFAVTNYIMCMAQEEQIKAAMPGVLKQLKELEALPMKQRLDEADKVKAAVIAVMEEAHAQNRKQGGTTWWPFIALIEEELKEIK